MNGRLVVSLFVLVLSSTLWPSAVRAEEWQSCTVSFTDELLDRMHVRCAEPFVLSNQKKMNWVAIDTSDQGKLERFQKYAIAALLSGKPLRFLVHPDPVHNVAGCQADNCRTPIAFGLAN